MSNLKHLNEDQLIQAKEDCEQYINNLRRKIGTLTGTMNGQETRLTWINTYLNEKSRQIVNGHPIYNKDDEIMESDQVLAMHVIEGGLAICMDCGSAEVELDVPCTGKPKSIDEIGGELSPTVKENSFDIGGKVYKPLDTFENTDERVIQFQHETIIKLQRIIADANKSNDGEKEGTLNISTRLGVIVEIALQNGRDSIEGYLNSVESPSHHARALHNIYQEQMDECDNAISGLHELFPVLFRVEK